MAIGSPPRESVPWVNPYQIGVYDTGAQFAADLNAKAREGWTFHSWLPCAVGVPSTPVYTAIYYKPAPLEKPEGMRSR